MKRIKKYQMLEYSAHPETDVPIENVIKYYEDLKSAWESKGFFDFTLQQAGSYDDCSLEFWGARWETDKEFERRQKKLAKDRLRARTRRDEERAAREAQDAAEWERLKKKFGG